jgi:hypothetical protein
MGIRRQSRLRASQTLESFGKFFQSPTSRHPPGPPPCRLGHSHCRKGRFGVHGRDATKQPKLLGLAREATSSEQTFECAVFEEQHTDFADALGPRQAIRRVTAQGDKVGHLFWQHPVTLYDLLGANARHFAGADRIKDGAGFRGKLEGVSVATGDGNLYAALPRKRDGRGEKIIGFIA